MNTASQAQPIGNSPNWRPFALLFGVFLLLKLSYWVFALGVTAVRPASAGSPTAQRESFPELAMRKDAYWYRDIAIDGYPRGEIRADGRRRLDFAKGQSAWAFFPAYPAFNAFLVRLLGVRYEIAALLSSFLFSLAALWCYFLFCRHYWLDDRKALFGTLLLFLFPFHFYFSMFLTEAPFLFFLVGAFYCLRTDRPVGAALLMIPLVLTRPNGLFLLLPLFLFYLERRDLPYLTWFRFPAGRRTVWIFLPAVLAFTAYLYYQYRLTGYFMAFSEAQQGWGKSLTFPLFALFRRGDLNYQFTSWYALLAGLFAVWNYRRLPLSFNVMIAIGILLPLSANSTYSVIRYLSVVFPLFLLLADFLYPLGRRKLVLTGLFILQLGSFYLWVVDHPLGF